MTATEDPLIRRPTPTGSGLAFVAGALAVSLVADAAVQRRIFAVAVAGILAFAGGGLAWRRGRTGLGALVALAGTVVAVFALGLALTRPTVFIHRLELVPGVLGLGILAAAVLPVRFGWERSLVDAGTGLLFLAVLTSGVVDGASLEAILAAGVLTILAWDAAENAVSVGGQFGARAPTARGELVHVSASALVAVGAIGFVYLVRELGIDELPFTALVALLVACVVLAVAYYR